MGCAFTASWSGQWVVGARESTSDARENEVLECHFYLLQWAFYAGFSVAERILPSAKPVGEANTAFLFYEISRLEF